MAGRRERRVAVVIPTRDRRTLLPRALDSVLGQSRSPDEVIVVDDGSSDGTDELLRERYAGITCLRQPHAGVSAARNRGVSASRCDWIAFLDSDDEWRPTKLEKQLEHVARNPRTVLCHTDETWIRDGQRINPQRKHAKPDGEAFHRSLELCCISPSSVLLRRDIFQAAGGFDETLPACEDYDLWLRLTARYPVALVPERLLIKYGGHDDQLSRRYWGMDRFRIAALEKILATTRLDPEQRLAARECLRRRIEVYLHGARKRSKALEVALYGAKLHALQAAEAPHATPTA